MTEIVKKIGNLTKVCFCSKPTSSRVKFYGIFKNWLGRLCASVYEKRRVNVIKTFCKLPRSPTKWSQFIYKIKDLCNFNLIRKVFWEGNLCGIFPNRFKTVTFQNTSGYALFYNCKKESILQNMGVASRSSLLPDDTIFHKIKSISIIKFFGP